MEQPGIHILTDSPVLLALQILGITLIFKSLKASVSLKNRVTPIKKSSFKACFSLELLDINNA